MCLHPSCNGAIRIGNTPRSRRAYTVNLFRRRLVDGREPSPCTRLRHLSVEPPSPPGLALPPVPRRSLAGEGVVKRPGRFPLLPLLSEHMTHRIAYLVVLKKEGGEADFLHKGGTDMKRSILLLAGACAASLLLTAPVLADCPPDSVQVGPICVDKYEASVWEIPATDMLLINKVTQGKATLANLTAKAGVVQHGADSDDY